MILLKLVVGIFTGSIGVLASAVDSLIDLVASLMTYFAIHIAETPPDEEHPFGHGKFEDFAGLLEAVLIMVGAFFILWEAIHRLIRPQAFEILPGPAMFVMIFSLVLDFIVSRTLFRIARETESPALLADAYHLSTDVWSSLAVITGLALVWLTGQHVFDPLMAIVVAAMILFIGLRIVRQVFKHLVDTALPHEEEKQIVETILNAVPDHEQIRVDALRTRRSGSQRLIIFNLLVSPNLTVEKAHEYCDQIEAALGALYPNSLVNIHLEPFPPDATA